MCVTNCQLLTSFEFGCVRCRWYRISLNSSILVVYFLHMYICRKYTKFTLCSVASSNKCWALQNWPQMAKQTKTENAQNGMTTISISTCVKSIIRCICLSAVFRKKCLTFTQMTAQAISWATACASKWSIIDQTAVWTIDFHWLFDCKGSQFVSTGWCTKYARYFMLYKNQWENVICYLIKKIFLTQPKSRLGEKTL